MGAGSLCPGDETVARFVAGSSLAPSADAEMRAHIDECPACRQLVAEVGVDEPGPVRTTRDADADFCDPGAIIGGKYEVLRVLGAGGMGVVLAARHLELGQTVAIKVMHAELASETAAVKRFVREGRAAALLRSDHAVRIHDVGRLGSGLPFLVMEHLVGEDLDHLAARRRLEVSEVVDYVLQAIAAIAEAHERGIVHRDIKPQNLFLARLPDGTTRVKVLDFGLAKDLSTSSSSSGSGALTTEHMILGSPHFMSPEQIRSPREVDARADVWALGASMVQLLTGRPPYTANNVHGLLARILADPAPKVSAMRADVPIEFEKVIERCMEKDLGRRYGSVNELADALRLAVGFAPAPTRAPDTDVPSTDPSTTIDAAMTTTQASPMGPPAGRARVTRVASRPPSTLAPSTVPELDRSETLLMKAPATLAVPTMPVPTLPTPTAALGDRGAPPTARAHVATLASLTPLAPEAAPRKRIRPVWPAVFFVVTFSATVVAGLAVRESQRRRDERAALRAPSVSLPAAATSAQSPAIVAAAPSPQVALPAPPEPAPPAPSAAPITAVPAAPGPKRPRPPTTPAAPASEDPYGWQKK